MCLDLILIKPNVICQTHLRQKLNSQQTCLYGTTIHPVLTSLYFLFIPLALFLGLYAASHARDIEWIMIKGISEYADGSSVSSDAWRRFASVMAASLTVNMLSEPIVFQTWPHYGGEA